MGEVAPGPFDMHLHLDWMADPARFSAAMAACGMGALGCTVTPAGYRSLAPLVAGVPTVRAGLGLHPWYLGRPDVAGGVEEPLSAEIAAGQLAAFCEEAVGTRWIGEVGLDFARAHEADKDAQLEAFHTVCEAVAPGSVLSIHAVRSAGSVLGVLGETGRLDDCSCVFHWFSGTSEELARARAAGCYFSVGPFMLKSKRGREYARQVPVAQLLLETDLPEGRASALTVEGLDACLREALDIVVALKGSDADKLADALAATSRTLLGL